MPVPDVSIAAPPEPAATAEVGSFDPGLYLDTANLALQISVALTTVLALLLALLTFLGLREVATLRRRQREVTESLDRAERTREEIEGHLRTFRADLESLVITAHLFNEGQVAYARAEYDRAITFYQQALDLQPDNARIQVRLARAFVNKGYNSRAERALRAALAKDPQDADAWRALATCRRYADLAEAIEHAHRATEIAADSSDNWNYLGLLLRDNGQFPDALSAFQEAEHIVPGDPFAKFYQGLILTRLGADEQAARKLRDARAETEVLRTTQRIKEIWCQTMEWAYHKSLGTPAHDGRAAETAGRLAEACKEARDRQAVLGHMIFYLVSRGSDLRDESSLAAFPAADVAAAVQRSRVAEGRS